MTYKTTQQINWIQNGEPVQGGLSGDSSGVANRAALEVFNNVEHVKALLDDRLLSTPTSIINSNSTLELNRLYKLTGSSPISLNLPNSPNQGDQIDLVLEGDDNSFITLNANYKIDKYQTVQYSGIPYLSLRFNGSRWISSSSFENLTDYLRTYNSTVLKLAETGRTLIAGDLVVGEDSGTIYKLKVGGDSTLHPDNDTYSETGVGQAWIKSIGNTVSDITVSSPLTGTGKTDSPLTINANFFDVGSVMTRDANGNLVSSQVIAKPSYGVDNEAPINALVGNRYLAEGILPIHWSLDRTKYWQYNFTTNNWDGAYQAVPASIDLSNLGVTNFRVDESGHLIGSVADNNYQAPSTAGLTTTLSSNLNPNFTGNFSISGGSVDPAKTLRYKIFNVVGGTVSPLVDVTENSQLTYVTDNIGSLEFDIAISDGETDTNLVHYTHPIVQSVSVSMPTISGVTEASFSETINLVSNGSITTNAQCSPISYDWILPNGNSETGDSISYLTPTVASTIEFKVRAKDGCGNYSNYQSKFINIVDNTGGGVVLV